VSDAARPAVRSVRVGLHFAESVSAARFAVEGCSRDEMLETLAPCLGGSEEESRRIAGTILRRLMGPSSGLGAEDAAERPSPLAWVTAAAGHTIDSRHLLLYAAARLERLVMAAASELFYPRFVLGRLPEGMHELDFAAVNTGKLLETDDVITHRLVDEYARRRWGLDDPSSTQCALRILREGGALGATWISRGETRCLGYFPTHRGPSWRVFTYALWEEFASRGRRTVPRAHLRSMALARLFCLHGPSVDVLAQRAAEAGFCAIDGERSGGPVSAAHETFEDAARALAATCRRAE